MTRTFDFSLLRRSSRKRLGRAKIKRPQVRSLPGEGPPEELAELERFVRHARREKSREAGVSVFDLPPLDLGRMLRPLGDREEWYDEMLEGRV